MLKIDLQNLWIWAICASSPIHMQPTLQKPLFHQLLLCNPGFSPLYIHQKFFDPFTHHIDLDVYWIPYLLES